MAHLSTVQIFQVLREAGFTPDQAVNFTAIAMAESGGDPHARLNTSAEDSRGLWQINLHAHGNYRDANLYDPLTNARAAYEVSNHGTNLYPWSTTHHSGGGSASYEKFLGAAREAAVSAGSAPPFVDPGGGTGDGGHAGDPGGTSSGAAGTAAAADPYAPPPAKPFVDSDHDGLSDDFEKVLGTDPHSADTDHDGLSDYQEVMVTHTAPTAADTDNDGQLDSIAVTLGHDPGHVPLSPAAQAALAAGGAVVGGPTGAAGAPAGSAAGASHDELSQGFENAIGVPGAGTTGPPVHAEYVATGTASWPAGTTGAGAGQPGVLGDGTIVVRANDGELLQISVAHLDVGAHPAFPDPTDPSGLSDHPVDPTTGH